MITPIKELRSSFVVGFLALFFYSFYSLSLWVLLSWSVWVLLFWLFKSKSRKVPSHPLAVLSPVDGKLLFTQAEKVPFLDVPGIHSRIIKPFYNEQVVYSPVEGTVKEVWFPHSEMSENKYSILIETDESDSIIIQLERVGIGFTRFYVQPGQRVGQGRKIGFCVFCHNVDVFIPENANIESHAKKVLAAEEVLAELLHEN